MSKAFQCDKCKRCFNPQDPEHYAEIAYFVTFENPVIQTRKDMKDNKVTCRLLSDPNEKVTLCAKCSSGFLQFMNKKGAMPRHNTAGTV